MTRNVFPTLREFLIVSSKLGRCFDEQARIAQPSR
jgi:hypothetical protein